MRRILPVYTVPVLRGPTAQALFDAEEALTAAHAKVEPDVRNTFFDGSLRPILPLDPGDERHRVMLSASRGPLALQQMIDDTARAVVADARAAMKLTRVYDVIVYHFPDGIGLIASQEARAAGSRRQLLSRTRLIVPYALSDTDAIAGHDGLQAMSRFWIDTLYSLNPEAAAGLACPLVNCLLTPPAPLGDAA